MKDSKYREMENAIGCFAIILLCCLLILGTYAVVISIGVLKGE